MFKELTIKLITGYQPSVANNNTVLPTSFIANPALSQEKARHRGGVPTQMRATVIGVYGLWSSAELSQKGREDSL